MLYRVLKASILIPALGLSVISAAPAQDLTREDMVIIGHRLLPSEIAPYSATRLSSDVLRRAPQRRLDDTLDRVPGVDLFRRNSSIVAHPTAQGISLRGVRLNGASRALVLLDGVPMNDPFGGWVYWSRLPTASLESVEIIRGGGAGPWGNQALAGTIRLASRWADETGFHGEAAAGTEDTYNLYGRGQLVWDRASIFISANDFSTDGYFRLSEEQRGPVDIRQSSEHTWVSGGVRLDLGDNTTAMIRVGDFSEDRGNGTPLATDSTDTTDVSARILHDPADDVGWEVTAYYKDQTFRGQFTAVNDARTEERPALNQFRVPSEAFGGSAILRFPMAAGRTLQAGADLRKTKGATNERFFFTEGAFVNQREAGGEQFFVGFFMDYIWQATERLLLTAGTRFDRYRLTDGREILSRVATGEIYSDTRFAKRSDWLANARLGAEYVVRPSLTMRVAGYTSYRVPTINELYRPFRVGNDVFRANAMLDPERLYGVDLGLAFQPTSALSAEVTVFHNRLEKGVANVFVTDEPGFNEEFGAFVPENGSLSVRRNVDRARIRGIELALDYAVQQDISLGLRYLLVDAEVRREAEQPLIEGNTLPQTPRHEVTLLADWRPLPRLRADVQIRVSGNQYENLLNTRKLDAYAQVDASLAYKVTRYLEVFGTVENLFDADIEAGKTADGLILTGEPVRASVGVRADF